MPTVWKINMQSLEEEIRLWTRAKNRLISVSYFFTFGISTKRKCYIFTNIIRGCLKGSIPSPAKISHREQNYHSDSNTWNFPLFPSKAESEQEYCSVENPTRYVPHFGLSTFFPLFNPLRLLKVIKRKEERKLGVRSKSIFLTHQLEIGVILGGVIERELPKRGPGSFSRFSQTFPE